MDKIEFTRLKNNEKRARVIARRKAVGVVQVNIFLEIDFWNQLKKTAKEQKCNVGDLIMKNYPVFKAGD